MCKNLKELMQKFNNEAACREFLIQQRWNGKPVCPYCGCTKSYNIENGKRFKCANKECYKKYSVTVGTVMEATNISLTTWLPAMYLITAHKKGTSSIQLGKDLGVTQKTAWFILHRIRESLKQKQSVLLDGIVELDEAYMSRKYASDYVGMSPEKAATLIDNSKTKQRGAVMAVKKRDGVIITKAFNVRTAETIKEMVDTYVSKDATLHTDEALHYRKALAGYNRLSVNHSKGQWSINGVSTNQVENFWSVMKRGVYGIYHQISYKHLQRYCDEYTFRFNNRDMKDGQRFELSCTKIEGRLTYNQLINNGKKDKKGKPNA
jgi:transposase-like protein